MRNGVAEIGVFNVGTVWATVGWDDSVERTRDIVVQEHYLAGSLHDFVRWSDARQAGRHATQDRILPHLILLQLFHLRGKFRLVLRPVRRHAHTNSWRPCSRLTTRNADRAVR